MKKLFALLIVAAFVNVAFAAAATHYALDSIQQ